PSPGGGSATFSVNVLNAVPTITSFSPTSAAAGTSSVPVQVVGTNFRSDSEVTVEGTPLPTTFTSATQLAAPMREGFLRRAGAWPVAAVVDSPSSMFATIPATLLQATGSLDVIGTNQAPRGGTSETLKLSVDNTIPVIESVSPAKFPADQPTVVLTVTGKNFAT